MAEQTVVPASSAGEIEDVFGGRNNVSIEEFTRYRQNPEKFKTADTADSTPADMPEETEQSRADEAESAPESDPEETQEPPHKVSGAERRIKQLLAEKKDLQRQLEAATSQDVKAESSPAKATQQTASPQAQFYTRPKPTVDDRNQDGTSKFAAYEDFVEDLADWKAEQRLFAAQRDAVAQAEAKKLEAKVEEARGRHENFDEVKDALLAKLIGSDARPLVPVDVLAMMNDSDYMADLVYTIGSDEQEAAQFVKMAKTNPHQAVRYIAKVEALIEDELSKSAEPNGKAPERQTKAPKPPSPVGGSSSRAFDVSDESLSPEEWMRKRNSDLARRHKG